MPTPACDSGSALRAPRPLPPRETHDGKVAGAAAEIGDEHRFVALERPGVPIGGAERLVGQRDAGHAGLRERRMEAGNRDVLVGRVACESDRATADDQSVEDLSACESCQEGRDQSFDREALPVEPRVREGAAGEMRLQRLHEALLADG